MIGKLVLPKAATLRGGQLSGDAGVMVDILLGAAVSLKALEEALRDFFGTQDVVVSEDFDVLLRKPASPAVFVMPCSLEVPGFPLGLSVMCAPNDPGTFQAMAVRLSRQLAARFDCDAMCDGSAHGSSPAPCWSILWREGRAYLADDFDCDADPPGPPQIRKRLLELGLEPEP